MNAEIDISSTTIRTERLLLRPWRESDLDDFYAYASVDGVGQAAGWLPHKDKAESQKILDNFIANKKTFAIEYEGRAVGSLGIELYNESELPEYAKWRGRELGFVLAKELWGRGLITEAVRAVIDFLFTEVKLDFLVCAHFKWNVRSARVQEKCGFTPHKEIEYETQFGTVEPSVLTLLESHAPSEIGKTPLCERDERTRSPQ